MKRKIGISYSEGNFKNYWNWFTPEDLDTELELIELSYERNNLEDLRRCNGLVLTGGVDVLPALYGGAEDYPNRPEEFLPQRDEFERKVYEYSQAEKVPLLGICRGMQYVNILEGGQVFEDNGKQINLLHQRQTEDRMHAVCVNRESLLFSVTGVTSGQVNSAHHQSVKPDRLGANLMVSAYATDPEFVIEGLEFKDKTDKAFMLCVQWHPERIQNKEANPLSQKIKEHFIEAVKTTNPQM